VEPAIKYDIKLAVESSGEIENEKEIPIVQNFKHLEQQESPSNSLIFNYIALGYLRVFIAFFISVTIYATFYDSFSKTFQEDQVAF
jgi:hypothetical protein